MVAVTLASREEDGRHAGDILLDISARESGPVGREIFTADDIGVSREIDQRDIVSALAAEANETHGVIRLGTTACQGIFCGIGIA